MPRLACRRNAALRKIDNSLYFVVRSTSDVLWPRESRHHDSILRFHGDADVDGTRSQTRLPINFRLPRNFCRSDSDRAERVKPRPRLGIARLSIFQHWIKIREEPIVESGRVLLRRIASATPRERRTPHARLVLDLMQETSKSMVVTRLPAPVPIFSARWADLNCNSAIRARLGGHESCAFHRGWNRRSPGALAVSVAGSDFSRAGMTS